MIDADGSMLGIVPTSQAQKMAEERNLDLVLFSPTANPPVCKILNYGKYRFDQIKKDKEDKKKATVLKLKEVQLSQTIADGDMSIKAKKTKEFLEEGCKIKVSIRMKGRQNAHPELSIQKMNEFFEMLSDVAVKEKPPVLEGRNVTMMLAPIPTKK